MASQSCIEGLPLEPKQKLLSALPDVPSLRSTVLICSSFYNAFVNAEILITTRVLTYELDADVLPEAVAALASSKSHP